MSRKDAVGTTQKKRNLLSHKELRRAISLCRLILLRVAGFLYVLGVRIHVGRRRRWADAGTSKDAAKEKTMAEDDRRTESAYLGGGCFWCMEAAYKRLDGVVAVVSGYAGGTVREPSYEDVCRGDTGHAEVVRVDYDPAKLSYDQILASFWKFHDPTTPNRQGNDTGTQYRSIVLFTDESQRKAAEESLRKAQASFRDRITTEMKPLSAFYPAEDYHQDYFRKNPNAGYCRLVIAPKLSKLGFPL